MTDESLSNWMLNPSKEGNEISTDFHSEINWVNVNLWAIVESSDSAPLSHEEINRTFRKLHADLREKIRIMSRNYLWCFYPLIDSDLVDCMWSDGQKLKPSNCKEKIGRKIHKFDLDSCFYTASCILQICHPVPKDQLDDQWSILSMMKQAVSNLEWDREVHLAVRVSDTESGEFLLEEADKNGQKSILPDWIYQYNCKDVKSKDADFAEFKTAADPASCRVWIMDGELHLVPPVALPEKFLNMEAERRELEMVKALFDSSVITYAPMPVQEAIWSKISEYIPELEVDASESKPVMYFKNTEPMKLVIPELLGRALLEMPLLISTLMRLGEEVLLICRDDQVLFANSQHKGRVSSFSKCQLYEEASKLFPPESSILYKTESTKYMIAKSVLAIVGFISQPKNEKTESVNESCAETIMEQKEQSNDIFYYKFSPPSSWINSCEDFGKLFKFRVSNSQHIYEHPKQTKWAWRGVLVWIGATELIQRTKNILNMDGNYGILSGLIKSSLQKYPETEDFLRKIEQCGMWLDEDDSNEYDESNFAINAFMEPWLFNWLEESKNMAKSFDMGSKKADIADHVHLHLEKIIEEFLLEGQAELEGVTDAPKQIFEHVNGSQLDNVIKKMENFKLKLQSGEPIDEIFDDYDYKDFETENDASSSIESESEAEKENPDISLEDMFIVLDSQKNNLMKNFKHDANTQEDSYDALDWLTMSYREHQGSRLEQMGDTVDFYSKSGPAEQLFKWATGSS